MASQSRSRLPGERYSLLVRLCSLTGDENMEGAVNEAAQDDQQNDQAGDSSSGIARRLMIFDGDVGVDCVASGNYVDSSCAPRA